MSFAIEIASVPDRDNLVAEIWWEGSMVAEVSRGAGSEFQIEVYPTPSGQPWSFDLLAWVDVLTEAQRRLG